MEITEGSCWPSSYPSPKGRRDTRKAYFHTNDRVGLGAHVTDAALRLTYPNQPKRESIRPPPTRRGWDGGVKSLRQDYVDRALDRETQAAKAALRGCGEKYRPEHPE